MMNVSLKRLLIRTAPLWAMGLLCMVAGSERPLILGMGIGLLLALANFFLSVYLSSRALSGSLIRSEAIILFGFLFRLTALGAIFYGLAQRPEIDLVGMLVTFAVVFTALLLWEVRIFATTRFHTET